MNQDDLQHLALVLLEKEINLGRALRENARLSAELEKKGGNNVPAIPPAEQEESKGE